MTNKDKYLKDGVDVDGLSKQIATYLIPYYKLSDTTKVYEDLVDFFRKPIKPTLTEDDKVILNRIRNFYTHIKRTNAGLKITSGTLAAELGLSFNMFDDNLFQFIKPRRRI